MYLWEDTHSINITASLNLEIIFSTSYTCLLRIFPRMHMYVSEEFTLIYILKFALDIRPVKVIKNPINPAVGGLLDDAEL